MKIISIIVDEIPKGCNECILNNYSERSSEYFCAGLKSVIPFGMNDFRRSDCPLEKQKI